MAEREAESGGIFRTLLKKSIFLQSVGIPSDVIERGGSEVELSVTELDLGCVHHEKHIYESEPGALGKR
jgi:hypothetical protein